MSYATILLGVGPYEMLGGERGEDKDFDTQQDVTRDASPLLERGR
jgi:hypothetical protein